MATKADFGVTAELNIDEASLRAAAQKISSTIKNAVKTARGTLPHTYTSAIDHLSGVATTAPNTYAGVAAYDTLARIVSGEANKAKTSTAYIQAKAVEGELREKKNIAQRAINRSVNKGVNYSGAFNTFLAAQEELEEARSSGNRSWIKRASANVVNAASAAMGFQYAGVRSAEDSQKLTAAMRDLTRVTKTNAAATIAATTALSAGLSFAGQALPSYWGQRVTRNMFATKSAQIERETAAGQSIGSVAGAVLGAAVGGAITSGAGGQIVGAQIGSNLGSLIGSLSGKHSEKEWEAQQVNINRYQGRLRALGLYGGAYSPTFGNAVAELGQASAGDVENMVGNSQTLAARMMFGQVGDMEMLLYSLMPNYFAAAMAGASDAELAAAYTRDLNALDPSLRLWVGSMVGGGSAGMVAFSQDKYSGRVIANAGQHRMTDTTMMRFGSGYQNGSVTRGVINAATESATFRAEVDKVAQWEDNAGIYERDSSIPMLIVDKDGNVIAANSDDLKGLKEEGKVKGVGDSWLARAKAWANRQGRWAGLSKDGAVSSKEDLSADEFEEIQSLLNSRDPKKVAAAIGRLNQGFQQETKRIIVDLKIDGVTQKVIDILGDETSVSKEISLFNLGR